MVSKIDDRVLYEDDELSFHAGDSLNGYRVNARAGVGTFCVVFESQVRDRCVAVKMAKQRYTSEKDVRAIDTEERIVAFLNRNYPEAPIITQVDTFEHEGRRCMVMERANGTLWDFMERDWPTQKKVLFEIAVGLAVLEDAGVIHADLKPCNVLMVDDKPKLADFNCSKWFESSGRYYGDNGTLRYMAPETLLEGILDTTSDVWSFGCVVAAVLWGNDVFRHNTPVDVVGAIVDLLGQPPFECRLRTSFLELSRDDTRAYGSGYCWSLSDLVSLSVVDECDGEHVVDLLSKVLQWSPEDRASPQELLEHPLFAGLHTNVQFLNKSTKKSQVHNTESLQINWQSETQGWEDIEESCEWDSVTNSSQWWGLDRGWKCTVSTWEHGGQTTAENDWGCCTRGASDSTSSESEKSEMNHKDWGKGHSVNYEQWAPCGESGYWSNRDGFENQDFGDYANDWKIDEDNMSASVEDGVSKGGSSMDTDTIESNEILGSVANEDETQNSNHQEFEEKMMKKRCANAVRGATIHDSWCYFWYGDQSVGE